jgi:hypothetical protein
MTTVMCRCDGLSRLGRGADEGTLSNRCRHEKTVVDAIAAAVRHRLEIVVKSRS